MRAAALSARAVLAARRARRGTRGAAWRSLGSRRRHPSHAVGERRDQACTQIVIGPRFRCNQLAIRRQSRGDRVVIAPPDPSTEIERRVSDLFTRYKRHRPPERIIRRRRAPGAQRPRRLSASGYPRGKKARCLCSSGARTGASTWQAARPRRGVKWLHSRGVRRLHGTGRRVRGHRTWIRVTIRVRMRE